MALSEKSQEVADASAMRQAIYGSGNPSRSDLADLIAKAPNFGADPEFQSLLVDVAKDVFLHQAKPESHIAEADAAWLIQRLADGGGLSCEAEFELLRSLFGAALSLPVSLAEFATREVEKAILTGRRDAIGGVDHEPGIVTDADVEALRAFAFAPTPGSSLHVGRGAAEALFDIAHATATSRNSPAFAPFFARAVGNYLLGAAILESPQRKEPLAREADQPTSFGGFIAAMTHLPSLTEFTTAMDSIEARQAEDLSAKNLLADRQLEAAAAIDAAEAKWVLAHLSRGGPLTEAERRLIAFLRDEATSAPAEIRALYDRAA